MIDYVVMRASQQMYCTDAQVMRGANCWTDHQMVRAKVCVYIAHSGSKMKRSIPFAVHVLRSEDKAKAYTECLSQQLRETPHNTGMTAEWNWQKLKSCIVKAAESTVGRARQKQPDWFIESTDILMPLLQTKNEAHERMLQNNSIMNRKEFRRQQRMVKEAVQSAKEKWILRVASEGEKAGKDGRTRWNCIKKLQLTHAGRRPTKSCVVLKEDGVPTAGPEEVRSRWHRHFSRLLNVPSVFQEDVIAHMSSQPICWDLDIPPTVEELGLALDKLKGGKAGGRTGILPEMILAGGKQLWSRLHQLMLEVWEEHKVVADWQDAQIVLIPKTGDLRSCDNWRGISLLDVVGKVFARIMQERLQTIADKVLPESQCGFRRGRGCTDMIFAARQMIEKAGEHGDTLFILFVDLQKAYNSVPRQASWQVLEKWGVPPTMLQVIRSFHEGMQAEVRIGNTITDSIDVQNGLRQGCTMAPTLFNIYFSAVVADWRNRCPQAEVDLRFCHGRKLVGDCTAQSGLKNTRVTESQFANDAAVYAHTREAFEQATGEFVRTASRWGLTVSVKKTKGMTVGQLEGVEDDSPVQQVEDGAIEMVSEFTYLGSVVTSDGELNKEVRCRIAKAARVFGCLKEPIFQSKHLSVETKRAVYRAVVLATLLYGADTWTIKAAHVRCMTAFHNRCLRTILGVSSTSSGQNTSRQGS